MTRLFLANLIVPGRNEWRRVGEHVSKRTWRDRWPAVPASQGTEARMLLPETLERVYASVAAYQHDASMLAKEGWQVVSVVHHHAAGLPGSVGRWWARVRRRAVPDLAVRYRRFH